MGEPDFRALTSMDLDEVPAPPLRDEFRVILQQEAFDTLVAQAHQDAQVEVGGVLVGRVSRDGGGPYVLVSEVIPARHSRQGVTDFTFTHEAWDHINKEMDTRDKELRIVGWYHTHPGFGLFLSEQDLFIQRNFFDRPFQVALVYDPKSRDHGCFAWRDGDAWRLRRYHVGGSPHIWDGERTEQTQRNKKLSESIKIAQDDETKHPDGKPQIGQAQAAGAEEGPGPLGLTILVALAALILGGGAGYYYRAWRVADLEARALDKVQAARTEGAREAVRLLRADLLSGVEDALNREKMWRPLAEIQTALRDTLNAITPPGTGSDAGAAPSPRAESRAAELEADLAEARRGLLSAMEELGKVEMSRLQVESLIRSVKQEGELGARAMISLGQEVMRMRAGLGAVNAELASQAAARGDRAAAERLLMAASAFDPQGAARYRKRVIGGASSGASPKNSGTPAPSPPPAPR